MMMVFTCASVRRRLQAFHDRELPIPDMIEVEAHAAECARCGSELRTLEDVGDAVRLGSVPAPAEDWIGLQPSVISRMRAEEHESLHARARRMFDDLHLVWIGLASAAAALVCVTMALASLQFASSDRRDSLAAMIEMISAPSGSDLNPVRVDHALQAPSVPVSGAIEVMLAEPISRGELVLALSAVVTREGRVADISVLSDMAAADDRIGQILDVLEHARLEPGRRGASPVAVNLVWLLAHTTVRPEPRARAAI